jgi:xylitol oxidase
VLEAVESALAPFEPRPHWGKLSTMPGSVIRPRFERLGSFQQLLAEWDPTGKFRNDHLDEILNS